MEKNGFGAKLFGLLFIFFLGYIAISRIHLLMDSIPPMSRYEYVFPISQSISIIASLITTVFIFAYLIEPNFLTKKIEEVSDLELKRGEHGLLFILLCGSLWLIFSSSLAQGFRAFEIRFILEKSVEFGGIDQMSVLLNQLVLLIPFVVIPISYMAIVNDKGYKEIIGFKKDNLLKNIVLGILTGFLILLCVGIVNYGLIQLFDVSQENMLLGQIANLGPFFALFLSLSAGISEEIFFRGFLQNKLGILTASFLFAITHAGYGILIQISGPFVFGLIIGFVYYKTKDILIPIIAHTSLNLAVLLFTMYSITP
ncbi:hypothetical protein C9439_05680 [archaeon SCG-AAA382B04]|nr:hypothetical protein C9439_05680 [archaeon SCG-AAA382B04]